MSPHEKWLVFLLRVTGVFTLLAFFAVFLPPAWMNAMHGGLGLGALPEGPIVDYLARSVSALYALHGGLVLFVSFDVRRYAGVIAYLAAAAAVFGIMMIGIDLFAGLPSLWVAGEGPPLVVMGIVILVLLRKVVTGRSAVAGVSATDA